MLALPRYSRTLSPTVKCGIVLPRCHKQCRSRRAIVASTLRCPVPSRWAHTNSRFFGESAPAGTQITRWPRCSSRYSPSESHGATPIAVSRVSPPSAAAACTPRTTSFVGNLSLPAKSNSVYFTLACPQIGPSDRVAQRHSSSHRQRCARKKKHAALPAWPLHLVEAAPSYAPRAKAGCPSTPDGIRQGACQKRYRAASWHLSLIHI